MRKCRCVTLYFEDPGSQRRPPGRLQMDMCALPKNHAGACQGSRVLWSEDKFEDISAGAQPPEAADGRSSRGKWESRLRPLMETPGTWARVLTDSTPSYASQLRRGRYRLPDGRWEFTQRRVPDLGVCIYARYLGPHLEEAMA